MRARTLLIAGCIVVLAAFSIFFATKVNAKEIGIRFGLLHEALDEDTAANAPLSTSTPSIALPIVVYHIVRPSYPSDSAAVRKIAVTPEVFDAELAHLKDAGYTVVGFHDLEAYFSNKTPLPDKPIIISLDDGWSDQYTYAFPVLEKHHDTATFFVFTNAIGRKGFLTWDDLKTLVAAGMTIGDHSQSHPYLTKITDPAKLWSEIYGSKTTLEQNLGISVTEFAYPFGQYNAAILDLVQKAGYKSARSDAWSGKMQSADQIYQLSAINAPVTEEQFEKVFP